MDPLPGGASLFAVTYLIMVPVFVYWAIDKRRGLYILASYYVCCGVNAVVKLTACIYRPWVRDPRVLPAGNAIATAGGYSFPSGHTVTAGPIYGGLALSSWKWSRVVSVVCVALVLLTGFSRNYLGVHTPQDVVVALLESALWLFVVARAFRYLEKNPERESWILLGLFVFGWLAIAYVTLKPYPMTYVDGKLLVDPQKMMRDGYGDVAMIIGFAVARFVEARWVRFEPCGLGTPGLAADGPRRRGLVASVLALVPLWAMLTYMKAPLDGLLGSHWGHFTYSFVIVVYCVLLVPAIIKLACARGADAEVVGAESAGAEGSDAEG